MVRMISSEGWPARVSDDQIIGSVGQRTFLRGRSYVRQGHVRSVNISAEGDILTGQVRGSGGRVYQTMVYCHSSDDPRPVWTSSCSCPVGTDCKHAVAVLLTARRQAVPGPVRAGAGWEGALADLLRVSDSDARPMALEVGQDDSAGDWPRRRRGLSLLPLVRGRNGWNRQGASWSQVLGGGLDGEVDDDVLQAVQEIGRMVPRSFYYSDDRVSLDDVPRRFWGALRRGVAAGLALTTAQRGGRPVRVSEGLRAGVSLRIAQDDSLVVAPALNLENVADLEGRVADNPPIAGIGSPIHGFVVECLDGGLVLMPIEPAPGEVLARLLADTTRRITVPPSDVPRFKSEYLEPLSRAVPVVIHDPDKAVARGAAVLASALSAKGEAWGGHPHGTAAARRITPVLPKAIGIKIHSSALPLRPEPYVRNIVPQNTPLPVTAKRVTVATVVADQERARIELYEQAGATVSEDVDANRLLFDGEVTGMAPAPAGSPIHLAVTVRIDGRIDVGATDGTTNRPLRLEAFIHGVVDEGELAEQAANVSGLMMAP